MAVFREQAVVSGNVRSLNLGRINHGSKHHLQSNPTEESSVLNIL